MQSFARSIQKKQPDTSDNNVGIDVFDLLGLYSKQAYVNTCDRYTLAESAVKMKGILLEHIAGLDSGHYSYDISDKGFIEKFPERFMDQPRMSEVKTTDGYLTPLPSIGVDHTIHQQLSEQKSSPRSIITTSRTIPLDFSGRPNLSRQSSHNDMVAFLEQRGEIAPSQMKK